MSNHQHRNITSAMPTTQKLMARSAFKPSWAAIASLVALSAVTAVKPAHAFGVTYNFTVQINSDAYEAQGLLNGMTEQGSFRYDTDGLTRTGSEQYVSALPTQGNLTLTFNFLNKIYTEKDDLNYGNQVYEPFYYPAAFFTNGQLAGLDFLVVPSQIQLPQTALGFRIYKDTFYFGAIDSSSEGSGTPVGTVAYIDTATLPEPPPPSAGVAAVPEPSEVGGAIVAFSVLGVWARKVRRQKVKGKR